MGTGVQDRLCSHKGQGATRFALPVSRRVSSPERAKDCAAALRAFGVPSFGQVIVEARLRHGLSAVTAAAAAKVSAAYYSDLENCKRLAPSRSTALRIARALRMSEVETGHLGLLAQAERGAAQREVPLPPQVSPTTDHYNQHGRSAGVRGPGRCFRSATKRGTDGQITGAKARRNDHTITGASFDLWRPYAQSARWTAVRVGCGGLALALVTR